MLEWKRLADVGLEPDERGDRAVLATDEEIDGFACDLCQRSHRRKRPRDISEASGRRRANPQDFPRAGVGNESFRRFTAASTCDSTVFNVA